MTQGIFSSLNITLGRLSAIEDNFSRLEEFSGQLNGVQKNSAANKSDFQTILDAKAQKLQPNSDNNNKEEDKKTVENLNEDLSENISSQKETNEINKENPKLKAQAIKLKSKIDLKAQTTNIDEIIETFSEKYGIDADFIKAVIKQESGFNTKAQSKKGAMGLMQLMPKTAQSLGVVNAFNPWENVEGGTKYLKTMLDKFQGNKRLALAAYNAGIGAVKRYGGIPPYKETQNYVNTIMSNYEKMQSLKESLQEEINLKRSLL